MDLGKIIEEIVPWIVLLGMFLPYLKKVKKAQDIAAARRKAAPAAAPRRRDPQWKAAVMPDVSEALPRTLNPGIARASSAPAHAAPLPDEGIRATADMASMRDIAPRQRSSRNREIRRALVWNEILNKKY